MHRHVAALVTPNLGNNGRLTMGTGNSLLNSGSEHYRKWTGIPELHGCTYCGSKEQDSAVLLLEQLTPNIILHVFFEADFLNLHHFKPCSSRNLSVLEVGSSSDSQSLGHLLLTVHLRKIAYR